MSDLGNKQVFAENLERYMKESGKSRNDICHALGFRYSTFSEWVTGKKYPRIDKIEMLANYFGVKKSDLIEEKTHEQIEVEKKAGFIAEAVLKMKTEPEFLSLVESLCELDAEQIKSVKALLSAFLK